MAPPSSVSSQAATKAKLLELLAKRKALVAAGFVPSQASLAQSLAPIVPILPIEPKVLIPHEVIRPKITYNAKQQQFINLVAHERKSVALTGPAGCGKTTSLTGALEAVIDAGTVAPLRSEGHKHLVAGLPGIVFVSFTNKAVNNIKKVLPRSLRGNAMTVHKLLEFEPVYEDVMGPDGKWKTTMQFLPAKNAKSPLPDSIQILVIDEAPMLSVQLWNQLAAALADSPIQVILVGDIQQLPPVFGKSIFIHAAQQGIDTIELTEVHRQALGSPILALATEIVKGKQIPAPRFAEFSISNENGSVVIQPWTEKVSDIVAIRKMHRWLPSQIDKGTYDPEKDIILTPYNKAFGTEILNQIVATHIAKKAEHPVFEIFAGREKLYFRIGERVLYNKAEARITKIEYNKKYFGKIPRMASKTMSYAGVEENPIAGLEDMSQDALDHVDFMLEAMASHVGGEDDKGFRDASHVVTIWIDDLGTELQLKTSTEVASLALGYAITVHKAQGSEYDRVFFLTHGSQATMLLRELIYTAVTRAKKELVVVCEPNLFVKGVNSQKLPGDTLAKKIENFEKSRAGKTDADEEMPKKMYLLKS